MPEKNQLAKKTKYIIQSTAFCKCALLCFYSDQTDQFLAQVQDILHILKALLQGCVRKPSFHSEVFPAAASYSISILMIWLFLWKLLVFHGIPLLIFIHRHLQPPSDLASSGNRGGDLKESHLRRVTSNTQFFWIFLIMQAWGIPGQELHYSIIFLQYAFNSRW